MSQEYLFWDYSKWRQIKKSTQGLSKSLSSKFSWMKREKHVELSKECVMRTRKHVHVVLVARISLTLSHHFSLSFIASCRSSGQHSASSQSCWMYVRAGRPAFTLPCVGVHKSTSLMSSSLLLQQCPACLVRLTIYIYHHHHHHHHHHHVVLVARISLTLSHHFSLSFIASGRSSGQHSASSQSCWMYVRAGRPAFARPCVGVHKSTSLMNSSLLLQQCPACLVRLTWIVFVIGGMWLYSWCLVGWCRQDLFSIARNILV